MDFQQMVLTLQKFWSEQDCILAQPYDMDAARRTDATATTPIACSSIISIRSLSNRLRPTFRIFTCRVWPR